MKIPAAKADPTSSSSSSTSPTTTVSSDSETRAREDLSGIDSYPVSVSSEHVERKERRDPFTKPTKNPKPNKNEDHEKERRDLYHSDIPELTKLPRVECWSSQEWKSDELVEVRTGRSVLEQLPGLFTEHMDKFIVDDNV